MRGCPTAEQTAVLQEDALRAAGCSRIWLDTASGTKTDRPQLAAVFDHLRAGDTIGVWRLDRLGRSLPHLIETIGGLQPMAAVWVTYLRLCKYCV